MSADVLLLTNATVPDKHGGLERYVDELAKALSADGRDVVLVAKRLRREHAERETTPAGVRLRRIPVPGKRNPLFALLYPFAVARGVRSALRDHPDAAVHAHFAVPALLLALTPARRRRPYLYTFHAPVYRELLSERQGSYLLPRPLQRLAVDLLRRTERLVVERAAAIVVLSEFMRDQLTELSPGAGARASLVPGGVDTEWFHPGPVPPVAWADEAEHLLVTARRLTPRTGVVELIRAMPAIVAKHPGTRLAVLGDGLLRETAERTVEELDLRDSVSLLGRVSEEDLRDWYRRADLAVTPTQELEGFGLSTAEAMACGTLPLVTPVGANPELVARLPRTCLADGMSSEDLGLAVSRRLADEDGPDGVGVRSLSEGWSWAVVARAHEPLLERCRRPRREALGAPS